MESIDSLRAYIFTLEREGLIDPNCHGCQEYFYSELLKGKSYSSIFAPRHKASDRCESGKYNHCSCDVCF